MAEISQNIKYVKLDDGVSFGLVRTNPKLTTNTKLMYNGRNMYMESYASSPLMNTTRYKNVRVRPNSIYNVDISGFLTGSGTRAYDIYQNFTDTVIGDSYDNQFENMYWCGAEYIESSFYTEEIGFIAPLYLREKLPNYFLIFRLDTPSNYNLNLDENGNVLDSSFDFKTDILDKAVLIKSFDLREGTVLGNYIHRYVEQDGFEFDKSMYVNFSNGEVTYYGINKVNGVFEKKVESFENELLKNDNPVLKDDKWFTEGFERNNLIFPYIMNIEYLFDDDFFNHKDGELYDFARYIGVYCNNIEFGEFEDLNELSTYGYTQDNVIYYFEDNKRNLHRYSNDKSGLKIDGKDSIVFNEGLISGFERERTTGYAEPLDIYEGFVNRAQYAFEILKPFEPGDWVGIEYDGNIERYFADNKTINDSDNSDFRFLVNADSTLNDIADALVRSVNRNKSSKFEAKCSDNVVVLYAKREGEEYNGSENGGAKIQIEASLLYNKKISHPASNNVKHICEESLLFGDYYIDFFCGACDVEIDPQTDIYKNIFKIYNEESVYFAEGRYLKTNNGDGRKISINMAYINGEGKIEPNYRLVVVENIDDSKKANIGYDVSVSSTYQVEIMDRFKPNHGVLSWFPIKDFDFDVNFSTYGQYAAFENECEKLSKKVTYKELYHIEDTYADSDFNSTQDDTVNGIKKLAKSPFYDDYGNSLDTEYDYYFEQIHPDLCLMSKSVPYISKWGYYDEQKDSCENPYRLNVNKVFGVSNLSANVYLRNCDENEYTHSMPYYMTLDTPNYYKDYQYISSDKIYNKHHVNGEEQYSIIDDGGIASNTTFETVSDCVNYWVEVFKRTDIDYFSEFFSGKKYGKRFDRKYSRLLGGDKFHNPSTLFRGVKFEAVRQFNGVEKRSSEYNDYKFSFIYIPIMIDNIVFNSTVYFVKNDTFKFIVGIIFVNTLLGTFDHNIFNGEVDYFNKGFIYAACQDKIRPENTNEYSYTLTLVHDGGEDVSTSTIDSVFSIVWKNNYYVSENENKFYLWSAGSRSEMIVTKTRYPRDFVNDIVDVIGEFEYCEDGDFKNGVNEGIKEIKTPKMKYVLKRIDSDNVFEAYWDKYYAEYDTQIYGYSTYKYYGSVICDISIPNIEFKNLKLNDVCDIDVEYLNSEQGIFSGYNVDISNLYIKSESLQNILLNMGDTRSVESIKIYNTDGFDGGNSVINEPNKGIFINGKNANIKVDVNSSSISIESTEGDNSEFTILTVNGNNGESIENLKMDIVIKDRFNTNFDSLGLKDYFSIFEQLSAHAISEHINNDKNVKYYSTTEDNKYKIRVITPDSIEIEDRYEAIPLKITQNNKNVLGSVEIREKADVDKIGVKVINRYSGYYNPIFNDILYYDDYTYTKSVGRLRNAITFELPYSNTNIDYTYSDGYGEFGVIRNMYYHKINTSRSDMILTSENSIYPAINEYALDYRDYNIFSSSWDEGYFISQDDLDTRSICDGIGSMKDDLCMFGSKYLNLPDYIFIDTFENGKVWDEKVLLDIRDNTDTEIMYKEINDRTVRYHLFIEKRLKRYLKEKLYEVFLKYINKDHSFGNKGTIDDDVEEYVEKNLLKLYKIDKVFMYIRSERMGTNNRKIDNDYLKYVSVNNETKIKNGFPVVYVDGGMVMKDSAFTMSKLNELDRCITYNLTTGLKESFGFAVSIKRK